MDYYIDIQLKPDAEFRINVLLNKVVTKFHKALFEMNANDIGISFPNYKTLLGNKIRLHGSENRLQELNAANWLGGLSGYCAITDIQKIPDVVEYRTVSRKQQNMTNAKLKRLTKRGSITEQEAKQYRIKMYSQGLSEAYIELESASNGHKHRRYIAIGDLQGQPVDGVFDHFGLSKTATIPWF
ncbi:type I-F CRISPR-associated endoribonuclease Cas6/Csy4 [Thiomicrorhabdus heinhorstiae]|uniref:Type I-F CRISPR-associated endoribonuclease Cas6/Csy4 n=1 Tax=Thiomicrorhabdus heinhorstiae TaxID=2748010 RepID=A0ABS0BV89_9GAMM|nr:type I-F CRISPR-associated endoribonuclease Cas6/Csy4 [Thiomicrorhabdus heinhorstiae]MBF6057700.1 type I-F CRISPR-associated endoribonuclease Cas6/Csy4 [Thiomicrorhabdus heinhorstiae]